MIKIVHLSVTAQNPERAAKCLAEMTNGEAIPFRSPNMEGAFVCGWDFEKNNLIEFLPADYLMHETDYGADFKKMPEPQNYNSTHFQIEANISLDHIKKIADKYEINHKFRPNRGGPLYDVWIEDQLLVEFVSEEITECLKD